MAINLKNMTGPALLIAGIIIGRNWIKIRKKLKPIANKAMKIVKKKSQQAYKETAKFIVSRKERIEDMIAKPRTKKVEKIDSPVEAEATKA